MDNLINTNTCNGPLDIILMNEFNSFADRWGMKPVECFGNLVIENLAKADLMETKFAYQPLLR